MKTTENIIRTALNLTCIPDHYNWKAKQTVDALAKQGIRRTKLAPLKKLWHTLTDCAEKNIKPAGCNKTKTLGNARVTVG